MDQAANLILHHNQVLAALTPVDSAAQMTVAQSATSFLSEYGLGIILFAITSLISILIIVKLLDKFISLIQLVALTATATIALTIPYTMYVAKTPLKSIISATAKTTPQNVQLINLTPHSFTLSFTTQGKTSATALYNQIGGLTLQAFDQAGNTSQTTKHQITATNLKPNTVYQISILSGGKEYNYQNKKLIIKTP